MIRRNRPFKPRKLDRLEFAIVRGLDTYATDIVAPFVHSIAELWISYVVYPAK